MQINATYKILVKFAWHYFKFRKKVKTFLWWKQVVQSILHTGKPSLANLNQSLTHPIHLLCPWRHVYSCPINLSTNYFPPAILPSSNMSIRTKQKTGQEGNFNTHTLVFLSQLKAHSPLSFLYLNVSIKIHVDDNVRNLSKNSHNSPFPRKMFSGGAKVVHFQSNIPKGGVWAFPLRSMKFSSLLSNRFLPRWSVESIWYTYSPTLYSLDWDEFPMGQHREWVVWS